MTDRMTRRERLEATVAGMPVDRVAVALWRHFPGDDQRPGDLAWATLQWQQAWDWDFIKVSPSSSFCLVDWGVADRWVGGDEGTREYTRRVVHRPEDWRSLPLLDPLGGKMGDQVECLRLIRAEVGDHVPFIQTVFSPLAQARNLGGQELLVAHMRQHPSAIHAGLETITQTTIRFVEACKSTDIAGIYYAVQLASHEQLSEAEYREFGEPYDRRVLAAAGDLWFNVLHLHGTEVMFDLVAGYPAQALNWHDRETPPSLGEGKTRFKGAVSGGLARWDDMLRGEPAEVEARVRDAVEQTGGRRLIVSSGCVTPTNAPFSNLRAVRQSVEKVGG